VQDTGCGIAPEHLPSIFTRFWQANDTIGGAGLGLAIVKGIVESHRGQIHVDSVPDVGTTFHLRLPCAAGADSGGVRA
jgi:two-component system sensor histidine kinase BaeS